MKLKKLEPWMLPTETTFDVYLRYIDDDVYRIPYECFRGETPLSYRIVWQYLSSRVIDAERV